MKRVCLVILTLGMLVGCAGIPLVPPSPATVGAECPPGSRGTGEVEVRVYEYENRMVETILCATPDGRVIGGRERVIQTPRVGHYSREYASNGGYVGVNTRVERGSRGYRGEANYQYQPSPFWGVTVRAKTGGGKQTRAKKPEEVCILCTPTTGCRHYAPHLLNKAHRKKYCRMQY